MKKRFWSFLLVLCMVLTLLPAAALAADTPGVTYTQKTANERTVTAAVSDAAGADSVKLTATMSYNGKVTETAVIEQKLEGDSFDFVLPYFGKWDVSAVFSKGGAEVGTATGTVALSADEYNIVLGGATTDVLVESLNFFIGTSVKNTVPTIVSLARFKQYNWDKLPENMYRDPLLTAEENVSEAAGWAGVKVPAMAAYVKQLHELNSASKFNFYISDFQLGDLPKVIYNNKLPAENYTLTLVTDGSATYSCFKHVYDGVDDAQAVHDQRVAEFRAYKNGTGTLSESINYYGYAILDVEAASSARWMVVRKSTDTFGIQDKNFQDKILGNKDKGIPGDSRISNNYINSLLANVDKAGKSDAFKALYNFDDSEFAKARAEGKKLMMMLGTAWNLENTYPPIEYMQFVTAFYGDEFAYFYKGHPGNYESNSPENTAYYKTINVGMLEPSIAAELFSFFNPDICVSGYESSYFQNTGEASQDFALFRRTKDVAYADGNVGVYADKMDLFISDMGDPFDTNTFTDKDGDSDAMKAAKEKSRAARDLVKAIIPEGEKSDKNYMVEFNNTADKTVCQYDYAIWNYTKSLIHYLAKDADGKLAIVSTVSAKGCDGGENCPSKAFTDVDKTLWYHDYVDYAVRNGLFNGTGDTTFEPDSAMTRAMLVTVLHRMDGEPAAKAAAKFVDVTEDWYKPAVAWAAENGIVDGMDDEHFAPNDKLTREQAMTMLMRYAKYKGMDVSATVDLAKFTDAGSISSWADAAVHWAVAIGLIDGVTDKTIEPQGNSTRAQIATILMRFQTNRV